jgi:hypothetical protein
VLFIVLLKVESQKTEEVHQESQDKAIVHQETILKVVNGVADHQETVQATSSTPTYSPKTTRKSTAPRFVSPLNGKIVDQGADVILDAVIDGKCIRQLSVIDGKCIRRLSQFSAYLIFIL